MSKSKALKENLKKRVKETYDTKDKGGAQGEKYLILKDGASLYKPKTGKNAIDIIPFKLGTNLFGKKGDIDYMLDVFIHKGFNQGYDQCLCLKRNFKKPCPICEAREQLRELDEDKYEDTIKSYNPKRRVMMNVINLKEDEEDENNGEIQILDEVHYFFEKELIEEAYADTDNSGDPVDFFTPDEGKSVFFRATDEKLGKAKFHKFKSFSFEERDEPYDEGIIDKAYSIDAMLHVPSYDEVKAMLEEESSEEIDEPEPDDVDDTDEDNEDDENDVEEVEKPVEKPKTKKSYKKPKTTSKSKTKPKPEPEPEIEDETENEDDEDEDEPDDGERCPYGKTFGEDADIEDETCLKCKKNNTDTFKECFVESLN